jgi:hypothetical protein
MLQPLVGNYLLEVYCDGTPSPALLRAMLTGADKHKTRDWMLLVRSCLEEGLCAEFLKDAGSHTTDVRGLRAWLAEKQEKDQTLAVVLYLVQLMQHRELYHNVRNPHKCM